MWEGFPTLRKVLEDKKIPDRYYGLMPSVDDNMFAALDRLVKIATLAHEHKSSIVEAVQSLGQEEMYRDLHNLAGELEAASSFLKDKAGEIREIWRQAAKCGEL